MTINIEDRYESERGCGYRKPGGKYLMGGSIGKACGRLPIPLTVCPCCNQGIKQTRGFSYLPAELISKSQQLLCGMDVDCSLCEPFSGIARGEIKEIGLMWIGEKFYPSYKDFIKEANTQGISKRIAAVPRGLEIGKTWVALAHPKVVPHGVDDKGKPVLSPGIFRVFRPTHMEYVVRERNGKVIDGKKKLADLQKRGFTLVRVHKQTLVSPDGFPIQDDVWPCYPSQFGYVD